MLKKLFLILPLVFIALSATYKTRIIFIDEELAGAKTIKTIVVRGYQHKTMRYSYTGSTGILEIGCATRNDSFLRFINRQKGFENEYAGQWPLEGDEVLMVADSNNRVTLFAKRIGDDYRFWDPNSIAFSNSVFMVKHPFKPLKECERYMQETHSNFCSDGCLLPAIEVKER